ncbi:MAG: hypothetical protein ACT4PW_12795 [Acidimicrobiia bacterium]
MRQAAAPEVVDQFRWLMAIIAQDEAEEHRPGTVGDRMGAPIEDASQAVGQAMSGRAGAPALDALDHDPPDQVPGTAPRRARWGPLDPTGQADLLSGQTLEQCPSGDTFGPGFDMVTAPSHLGRDPVARLFPGVGQQDGGPDRRPRRQRVEAVGGPQRQPSREQCRADAQHPGPVQGQRAQHCRHPEPGMGAAGPPCPECGAGRQGHDLTVGHRGTIACDPPG